MKIAVEGCAHGELDKIYETLHIIERDNNIKIDLLLCCGDFQAVRNESDLACMAVPQKYQSMCTFYKYYSGEKIAPILTVFVGGNHEASNYLGELAYGGWVCPRIYYLGYAGVVKFGGIRIAGISGIFKGHDFLRGHFEKPPYDNHSKRSAYHIRNVDVHRLKQISQPIDVFLSHDWPRGIYHYGDLNALLRRKPFLRDDVSKERLGSGPTWDVLQKVRPDFWFAAHLHVKFPALVKHSQNVEENTGAPPKVTRFLALDKCLPRRDFLQVLDIGPEGSEVADHLRSLSYDEEWLCILRSTNHLLSVSNSFQYLPAPTSNERWDFRPTERELLEVRELFKNDFRIPENFQPTADTYDPTRESRSHHHHHHRHHHHQQQPKIQINPQTKDLCLKLGISDPFQLLLDETCRSTASLTINSLNAVSPITTAAAAANKSFNPDEVILDDDEYDEAEDSKFSEMPSTDASGLLDDSTSSTSASTSMEGNASAKTPSIGAFASPRSKLVLLPPMSSSSKTSVSPLLLPLSKPSACSTPLRAHPTSEPTPSEDVADQRTASTPKSPPTVVQGGASPPLVKRFKRRNQAIYATKEEDLDGDQGGPPE